MDLINFHHICIQTDCYSESLAFYKDFLGFKLIKETPDFHGRDFNTWLSHTGIRIELQTPKKNTLFQPWSNLNAGPVHLAFVVEDVLAAYEALVERGYTRFKLKNGHPVYEVEGGKLLKIRAPEGTEIELRDQIDISEEAL